MNKITLCVLLFIVSIFLFSCTEKGLACSTQLVINKPFVSTKIITLPNGVECVVYKSGWSRGMSCDWDTSREGKPISLKRDFNYDLLPKGYK